MAGERGKKWKGIVLAGGTGSRLFPITRVISKQALPVYDKPMIFYPLSTLMLGGIREILIISTPRDLPQFRELLGDGAELGVRFSYAEQAEPRGIAEAFLLGEEFLDGDNACLILGDNLFYGNMEFFRRALRRRRGATIFGYAVHDPQRYGVVEFDRTGKVVGIEEKPAKPKSRFAIPGLYCYDSRVVQIARDLAPSGRNELEITDVNKAYLAGEELHVELLGRGIAWLDTGTAQSLLEASSFVASIESRQGLKIGCLEEVAYRMGFIDLERLSELSTRFAGSEYGRYLQQIVADAQSELPGSVGI